MIRRFGGLLAAGLLASLLPLLALGAPRAAAQPGGERMLSYVVTADVRADGTVAVTERVRYHFDAPRHGFFRFIPQYYPLNDNDARKLEIDNYTATMDGHAVPFVHDTEADGADENFILRIGDPNTANVTGDHDYEFSYQIRGLLNAPDGTPELFWQALGKESKVPVDHAEVTVTAPGPITRIQCRVGRGTPCATATVDGSTARFAADRIGSLTAVNVTVALPDTVSVPAPIIRANPAARGGIRDNLANPGREAGIPGLTKVLVALEFVLGLGLLALILSRGRDRYFVGEIPGLLPQRPATAPQHSRLFAQRTAAAVRFDPPKGVPAALCGVILRKKADKSAVAAAITDLAVRGHLKITEVSDGFRVERLKNTGEQGVQTFESPILGALDSPVLLPGERASSLRFRRALGRLPLALMADAQRRKWFRGNPALNKFRGWGFILLILSVWPLVWLAQRGLLWLWIPFGLLMLTLIVLPRRWLAGRSAVGSTILAQVLDFRRYIETAEAEQLAEEERSAIFNRYLPYAQVFGLAEHWTKKFAAVGAAEPGDWYVGSGDPGVGYYYFGDSYSSFTSTVDSSVASGISVHSSTGSSSGWSSGSSGFDSGGSSGGGGGDGGGGGGGGSW